MIDGLKAPFPAEKIHWRAGATTKDKSRCLALAYIDARDVMERLDEVVGPENWQTRHEVFGNVCICHLGIKCGDEWVWKSNGAGQTDVEADKGMVSDATKRAAVEWGVGRYLYGLPAVWVPYDAQKKTIPNAPALPAWALPGTQSDTDAKFVKVDMNAKPTTPLVTEVDPEQEKWLEEYRGSEPEVKTAGDILAKHHDPFEGKKEKLLDLCIKTETEWATVEGWILSGKGSPDKAIESLEKKLEKD